MKFTLVAVLATATLTMAAPARFGGNNIANSAAGLANSIQGGNGASITKAALDLAASIAGAGAFAKRQGGGAQKSHAQAESDKDEDDDDEEEY